jgi:hypothetical protein
MFLLIFYYSCMYYNMHSLHCGLFPFHYKWICWCTCCCASIVVSMWPLSPSYMDMVPIATYIPNFVIWNTMGVLVYWADFVSASTCCNCSCTFVATTLVCFTRWAPSYFEKIFFVAIHAFISLGIVDCTSSVRPLILASNRFMFDVAKLSFGNT